MRAVAVTVFAAALLALGATAGHTPPHIPSHVQDILDHADRTHMRHFPDFKYEGFDYPHQDQPAGALNRRGTGPHDVRAANESHKPNEHMANYSTPYPLNVLWLLNMFESGYGIPRSYNDILPNGQVYWGTQTYLSVGAFNEYGQKTQLESMIGIQERTLTRFGLNLYDAAVWQIALSLWWLYDVAHIYENNILYTGTTGPAGRKNGAPGGLTNIRADSEDFQYGSIHKTAGSSLKTITYPGNVSHFPAKQGKPEAPVFKGPGSYFYRMIAPKYQMVDPMNGNYGNAWKYPWPNYDSTTSWNVYGMIHFNDWKPITGENSWGAMLGPIQALGLKTNNSLINGTCGNEFKVPPLPCDFKTFKTTPNEVQLGISIIPAMLALQGEPGLLFHCPWGAKIFPPDPDEGANVSNENNFSGYAGIDALYQVLNNFTKGSSDEELQWALTSITMLRDGLQKWFNADTLLSKKGQLPNDWQVIPQGGHYNASGWFPVPLDVTGGLAVDCQTWGMSVLGRELIDSKYGAGFAYNIWQTTKKYAGYYKGEVLCGVGYTDLSGSNGSIPVNNIWSAEWTFGAINMAQILSQQYRGIDDTKADSLLADAQSMLNQVTLPWPNGLRFPDGSYVYANKRFFIPWGWFSNPISALCSTGWSVMMERNFDPFHYGGGNKPPLVMPQHVMESDPHYSWPQWKDQQ
mmetsp:Transcript_17046/g.52911  ORF Transcript_17046/g.52911 Transcript_17046/m.52911 type:complete len:688 (-) Transcript_17046:305-2368(-)